MKKIFFLAAAILAAVTINAQRIEFTEAIAVADFGASKVFANGEVELEAVNVAGKMSVDANKTKFGTSSADMWQSAFRLKTGGASSVAEGKEMGLTLYVPSAGVVKVYARTASGAAERAIIMTQDGNEVFNHAYLDAQAVVEGDITIYPIYTSEKVAAGEINIEFGKVPEGGAGSNGGVNIYAIEFIADPETAISNTTLAPKAQKIMENGQLVILRDGVKYNALGAVID